MFLRTMDNTLLSLVGVGLVIPVDMESTIVLSPYCEGEAYWLVAELDTHEQAVKVLDRIYNQLHVVGGALDVRPIVKRVRSEDVRKAKEDGLEALIDGQPVEDAKQAAARRTRRSASQ